MGHASAGPGHAAIAFGHSWMFDQIDRTDRRERCQEIPTQRPPVWLYHRVVVEALTSEQFHRFPGLEGWHVQDAVASTSFATNTFSRGVLFVNAIGALADAADHHPDVDLRYSFVDIRLTTHEINALSERDAALAVQISEAARELGIEIQRKH